MPGSAHRRHGDLVRQRDTHVHPVGGQLITDGDLLGRVVRKVDAARSVGPMIVNHFAADREQMTAGVDGHLDIPILIAFLGRGDEVLQPIFDPLHRASDDHRTDGDTHILGIENQLGSKPTAYIGCHDAHGVFVETEHVAQHPLCSMRHLGGGPHRQPFIVFIKHR